MRNVLSVEEHEDRNREKTSSWYISDVNPRVSCSQLNASGISVSFWRNSTQRPPNDRNCTIFHRRRRLEGGEKLLVLVYKIEGLMITMLSILEKKVARESNAVASEVGWMSCNSRSEVESGPNGRV